MEQSSLYVYLWWAGLTAVALLNVCLWFYARHVFKRRQPTLGADVAWFRRRQLVLSAIYVLGCGFRSILPRGDVQRIVLYDSWLSSVVVGRSVATIAELAFVAQWALLLREIGKGRNSTLSRMALMIVPLITIAELCSWYGVLTTNYLGNAIEESIWAMTAGIAVTGFWFARPHYEKAQRAFLNAAIVLGLGYIAYMAAVDVPAYVTRYLEAEAAGAQYLSLAQGFSEVSSHWTVTRALASWHYAMVWMSLYFSIAVWISLALVNAPRMDAGRIAKLPKRPGQGQRA